MKCKNCASVRFCKRVEKFRFDAYNNAENFCKCFISSDSFAEVPVKREPVSKYSVEDAFKYMCTLNCQSKHALIHAAENNAPDIDIDNIKKKLACQQIIIELLERNIHNAD